MGNATHPDPVPQQGRPSDFSPRDTTLGRFSHRGFLCQDPRATKGIGRTRSLLDDIMVEPDKTLGETTGEKRRDPSVLFPAPLTDFQLLFLPPFMC
ncbi:hypothetical protein E2320_000285 [Naja naja]|nr:hypothetical protein E2320_000285 [Naja naja]